MKRDNDSIRFVFPYCFLSVFSVISVVMSSVANSIRVFLAVVIAIGSQ